MELSIVACKYLKILGLDINSSFLIERIRAHPNFPSLLSFADTLASLGIEYSVCKIDFREIPKERFPLLMHFPISGTDGYVIIRNKKELFDFHSKNKTTVNERVVCSVPQKQNFANQTLQRQLLKAKKQKQKIKTLFLAITLLFLLTFWFKFSPQYFVLSLISALGIFISFSIINENFGSNISLFERLCRTGRNHNCNRVINSKYSKLFETFSISDISVIYFTSFLLTVIFLNLLSLNNSAISFLLMSTALGIIVAGVSIWVQINLLKSWCQVCLTISAILTVQFLIVASMAYYVPINFQLSHFAFIFVVFLGFSLLAGSFWTLMNDYFQAKYLDIQERSKLLRIKNNPLVFLSLLERQPQNIIPEIRDELILGNPKAAFQFIVACSPFCPPCAHQHMEIENILQSFPNQVCFRLRFIFDNKDSNSKQAAFDIINHYYNNGDSQTTQKDIIHSWFQIMNIDIFRKRWGVSKSYDLSYYITSVQSWAKYQNITHTPTTYLNGHEVPADYSISDFENLINPLYDHLLTQ